MVDSLLRELGYLQRGELSSGVVCFPVCSSSAAAFLYALSSAASVIMSSMGSFQIFRQCIVSSSSLGSSSSSVVRQSHTPGETNFRGGKGAVALAVPKGKQSPLFSVVVLPGPGQCQVRSYGLKKG